MCSAFKGSEWYGFKNTQYIRVTKHNVGHESVTGDTENPDSAVYLMESSVCLHAVWFKHHRSCWWNIVITGRIRLSQPRSTTLTLLHSLRVSEGVEIYWFMQKASGLVWFWWVVSAKQIDSVNWKWHQTMSMHDAWGVKGRSRGFEEWGEELLRSRSK